MIDDFPEDAETEEIFADEAPTVRDIVLPHDVDDFTDERASVTKIAPQPQEAPGPPVPNFWERVTNWFNGKEEAR